MKKTDFAKIGTQLLELLPKHTVKGDLLYIVTQHRLLAGISFEGSSFNKETFFMNYFVMPLGKPIEHLYFNFGDRLRNRQGADLWSSIQENLIEELKRSVKEQVVPYFSIFEAPEKAIDLIKIKTAESKNFRTWETGAALLASYGDTAGAINLIDRCLQVCDSSISWHREIAEYLEELRKACLEGSQTVEAILDSCVETNLINLKLKA